MKKTAIVVLGLTSVVTLSACGKRTETEYRDNPTTKQELDEANKALKEAQDAATKTREDANKLAISAAQKQAEADKIVRLAEDANKQAAKMEQDAAAAQAVVDQKTASAKELATKAASAKADAESKQAEANQFKASGDDSSYQKAQAEADKAKAVAEDLAKQANDAQKEADEAQKIAGELKLAAEQARAKAQEMHLAAIKATAEAEDLYAKAEKSQESKFEQYFALAHYLQISGVPFEEAKKHLDSKVDELTATLGKKKTEENPSTGLFKKAEDQELVVEKLQTEVASNEKSLATLMSEVSQDKINLSAKKDEDRTPDEKARLVNLEKVMAKFDEFTKAKSELSKAASSRESYETMKTRIERRLQDKRKDLDAYKSLLAELLKIAQPSADDLDEIDLVETTIFGYTEKVNQLTKDLEEKAVQLKAAKEAETNAKSLFASAVSSFESAMTDLDSGKGTSVKSLDTQARELQNRISEEQAMLAKIKAELSEAQRNLAAFEGYVETYEELYSH